MAHQSVSRGKPSVQRRLWVWTIGGIIIVVAGLGFAALPATTRQGLNFEVSARRTPLYIKAMEFLVRDHEYRRLADEITAGATTDEQRALALFGWTRTHIRPRPGGWPVVDDHILNIIIRGYGEDDQMADVFTTLTTYAGVPAF